MCCVRMVAGQPGLDDLAETVQHWVASILVLGRIGPEDSLRQGLGPDAHWLARSAGRTVGHATNIGRSLGAAGFVVPRANFSAGACTSAQRRTSKTALSLGSDATRPTSKTVFSIGTVRSPGRAERAVGRASGASRYSPKHTSKTLL